MYFAAVFLNFSTVGCGMFRLCKTYLKIYTVSSKTRLKVESLIPNSKARCLNEAAVEHNVSMRRPIQYESNKLLHTGKIIIFKVPQCKQKAFFMPSGISMTFLPFLLCLFTCQVQNTIFNFHS